MWPWLGSLGVTKGTIGRILKGSQSPGADLLRALQRTERVSLLWLEENKGSPYRVTRVLDDAEAQAVLSERLREEWTVILVTSDDATFAVVLQRPEARYTYKKKEVIYIEAEIIAGGITLRTERWLDRQGRGVWLLRLTPDEMEKLSTGHMGNIELFGFEDARKQSRGLWKRIKAKAQDARYEELYAPDLESRDSTGQTRPAHGAAEPAPAEYGAMPDDEQDLLNRYRALSEEKRRALRALLR